MYYCQTVAGLLMWGALSLAKGRVSHFPESQSAVITASILLKNKIICRESQGLVVKTN
jgi:hypothetical protein